MASSGNTPAVSKMLATGVHTLRVQSSSLPGGGAMVVKMRGPDTHGVKIATRNPKSLTLYPKPLTPNPKPSSQEPKSQTPSPKL